MTGIKPAIYQCIVKYIDIPFQYMTILSQIGFLVTEQTEIDYIIHSGDEIVVSFCQQLMLMLYIPAKLGAISMWLERNPQNMPPMQVTPRAISPTATLWWHPT